MPARSVLTASEREKFSVGTLVGNQDEKPSFRRACHTWLRGLRSGGGILEAWGTEDDLHWDRYACIAPAGSRMDRPMPSPNELDRCLAKKGWRRVNPVARPAH